MKQVCYALIALLALAGCTPAAESSNAVAESLTAWKNDTGNTWSDLFRYNPKPRTPQPSSTRYCYQFASDVVCYDNPQPQLTSKIVGVQGAEGPRIVTYPAPVARSYAAAMMQEPMLFPGDVGVPPAASALSPVISGSVIESRDLPAPFAKQATPAPATAPIAPPAATP